MKKLITLAAVLLLSGCSFTSDPNLCDKPEYKDSPTCTMAHG